MRWGWRLGGRRAGKLVRVAASAEGEVAADKPSQRLDQPSRDRCLAAPKAFRLLLDLGLSALDGRTMPCQLAALRLALAFQLAQLTVLPLRRLSRLRQPRHLPFALLCLGLDRLESLGHLACMPILLAKLADRGDAHPQARGEAAQRRLERDRRRVARRFRRLLRLRRKAHASRRFRRLRVDTHTGQCRQSCALLAGCERRLEPRTSPFAKLARRCVQFLLRHLPLRLVRCKRLLLVVGRLTGVRLVQDAQLA